MALQKVAIGPREVSGRKSIVQKAESRGRGRVRGGSNLSLFLEVYRVQLKGNEEYTAW